MWSNLVSNPRRGRLVVGLFILSFGVAVLMAPSAGRMAQRGVEVIDLQFMRTPGTALTYLTRLGPEGIDAARTNLYVDFVYIVVYAIALVAACIVVAARASERGRDGLASFGRLAAILAPIAAACDAGENAAILWVLADHVEQPWPAIAFGFATVKWILAAIVIVYLVVGLVLTARRRTPEEAPAAGEPPPTGSAEAAGP